MEGSRAGRFGEQGPGRIGRGSQGGSECEGRGVEGDGSGDEEEGRVGRRVTEMREGGREGGL